MERLVPGVSETCKSCTYRLPDRFPNLNYPCAKLKIESGIMTSPKINLDICETYRPNLTTSVRELATRARSAINRVGLSMPPF